MHYSDTATVTCVPHPRVPRIAVRNRTVPPLHLDGPSSLQVGFSSIAWKDDPAYLKGVTLEARRSASTDRRSTDRKSTAPSTVRKIDTSARPGTVLLSTSITSRAAPLKEAKKKGSSMLKGLVSFKNPAQAAFDQYAEQQLKAMAEKGGRPTPVGLAAVSSKKLPSDIPKVNSKWDGMPEPLRKKKFGEEGKANKRRSQTTNRQSSSTMATHFTYQPMASPAEWGMSDYAPSIHSFERGAPPSLASLDTSSVSPATSVRRRPLPLVIQSRSGTPSETASVLTVTARPDLAHLGRPSHAPSPPRPLHSEFQFFLPEDIPECHSDDDREAGAEGAGLGLGIRELQEQQRLADPQEGLEEQDEDDARDPLASASRSSTPADLSPLTPTNPLPSIPMTSFAGSFSPLWQTPTKNDFADPPDWPLPRNPGDVVVKTSGRDVLNPPPVPSRSARRNIGSPDPYVQLERQRLGRKTPEPKEMPKPILKKKKSTETPFYGSSYASSYKKADAGVNSYTPTKLPPRSPKRPQGTYQPSQAPTSSSSGSITPTFGATTSSIATQSFDADLLSPTPDFPLDIPVSMRPSSPQSSTQSSQLTELVASTDPTSSLTSSETSFSLLSPKQRDNIKRISAATIKSSDFTLRSVLESVETNDTERKEQKEEEDEEEEEEDDDDDRTSVDAPSVGPSILSIAQSEQSAAASEMSAQWYLSPKERLGLLGPNLRATQTKLPWEEEQRGMNGGLPGKDRRKRSSIFSIKR